MNEEIIKILNDLKSSPKDSEVDHLFLLNKLYFDYADGLKELQPIMNYYLNGLDNLPTLQERDLWNKAQFEKRRKPFTDSHDELIDAIEEVLRSEGISGSV